MDVSDNWITFSDLSLFDVTKLIINDPVTQEFKTGTGSIQTTMSAAGYMCEDEQVRHLCIVAPTQVTFGPSYTFDMSTPKDDQNKSKATGVQLQYPITSMQTISTPSPDEELFINVVESIRDLAVENYKSQVETAEALQAETEDGSFNNIPAVSYSSALTAIKLNDWNRALKSPFEHPKDANKKIDKTKPKKMYVKFKTSGKGDKMRVLTKIYSPDSEEPVPVTDIMNKRGKVTPCFEFEGIYWGQHGTNSHGASLRFRLVEANFEAIEGGQEIPKKRLLPGKTTTTSKSSEPEEEPEDGTFAPPKSKALANLVKTGKAPVPKAKAAPKGVAPKAKAASPKATAPVAKAKTAPVPKAKAGVAPAPKAVAKALAPKAKAAPPKVKAPPPAEEEVEEEAEATEDWDE